MTTVQALAEGRDNNFNAIRLFAASAVIVAHGYPLAGVLSPLVIMPGYDLGGAAVTMFFGISGLLIVKSYLRTASVLDFATARFMRLMPGLAVALALAVFVVGPLVTDVPITEYLRSGETWSYLAHNILLWNIKYYLPGVFWNNPYPGAVNGSIWSLPFEVACYLGVVFFGTLGMLQGRRPAILAVMFAVFYVAVRGDWYSPQPKIAECSLAFVIGGAFYVWRTAIPLTWGMFALVLTSTMVLWSSPVQHEMVILAIVYGTFLVAAIPCEYSRRLERYGDFSYGIYIYGFTAQQIVASTWHGIRPLPLAATGFLLALPLAIASWHFVEKPALDHRHMVGRRLTRVLQPIRS